MIKVCVIATFEIEVDNEDEPDRLEDLKRELEEQITNDIVASSKVRVRVFLPNPLRSRNE